MKKFIKFTVVTAMLVGAVWYGYQNGKADGFEKAMELRDILIELKGENA